MSYVLNQRRLVASQFMWAIDPAAQQELLVSEHAASLPAAAASDLLRQFAQYVRSQLQAGPDTTWELPASGLPSESPIDTLQRSQP
jgi:hypothetical protein